MYPTTSAALPAGLASPSSIPPPPSLPFFFRRRTARLDFSRLQCLDLDQLVRSVDIAALQQSLDQLAFSDLAPSDLPQLTPAVLVKGWRLLQLTVEYLLHVQSFLYHAHATAQYECETLARKCVAAKEQHRLALRLKDKELRRLGKELKHAQQQLNTLDSFSPPKLPHQPPAIGDGAVHACSDCHAAFISASYLASHVKRRHPHTSPPAKPSRSRRHEEHKEQLSATAKSATSESDWSPDRRRRAEWSEQAQDERAKDQARLRQIEVELREEREREKLRLAHLDQLEQRHRQADEQREMRWHQQLNQQQSSLIAHLAQQQQPSPQQQPQQQLVSVEWLRDWQAEMQSMMESRLNDCFQREESKREARLMARLEDIEERVRDVKGSELEAGVRRVVEEIAALKADTARLIDVREQERRDEEQRGKDDRDAAVREREARELDERHKREEEADALTQRALLLEQQRLELERSQEAIHSHSHASPSPTQRPPRYPVVDSLPFLLARYPHSPATVTRIANTVSERATAVERRRSTDPASTAAVSDDAMPDELAGLDRRVDELVAQHWREEQGQVQRRAGLEERMRGLELERERMRREAEEERRQREEERREEEELDEAMRALDRQKDEIERERAELNQRNEQEERRKDAEMQAEIDREMQQLKRDQLVQQEKLALADKQRLRNEQDRRDREDEQRWRAEELAREQLRTSALRPTPALTPTPPPAPATRPAPPPPLQMTVLGRQQSSPSLPTPAFTTHVAASPMSAMSGMGGGGMLAARLSLEAKGVEEKQEEAEEDDEWGWEKDEEQKQPTSAALTGRPHSAASSTASTSRYLPYPTPDPSHAALNDDDDGPTAALFQRGAAGSTAASRSPATLAERKQALMDRGFGLRLQTPAQRRDEDEARRLRGQGRGGELVELDSARSVGVGSEGSGGGGVSPVLEHAVKGRAHIVGGRRHGGGRGMVAAFRPSSAASNASLVSGGSWDD